MASMNTVQGKKLLVREHLGRSYGETYMGDFGHHPGGELFVAREILVVKPSNYMITLAQVAAIVMLLQAFGVDASTIAIVRSELTPPTTSVATVNSTVIPQIPTAVTNQTIEIGRVNYDNGLGGLYYLGSAAIDPSNVHVSQNGQAISSTIGIIWSPRDMGQDSFLVTKPDGTTHRVVGGVAQLFSFSPALTSGLYDVSITDASGATIFSTKTTVD